MSPQTAPRPERAFGGASTGPSRVLTTARNRLAEARSPSVSESFFARLETHHRHRGPLIVLSLWGVFQVFPSGHDSGCVGEFSKSRTSETTRARITSVLVRRMVAGIAKKNRCAVIVSCEEFIF